MAPPRKPADTQTAKEREARRKAAAEAAAAGKPLTSSVYNAGTGDHSTVNYSDRPKGSGGGFQLDLGLLNGAQIFKVPGEEISGLPSNFSSSVGQVAGQAGDAIGGVLGLGGGGGDWTTVRQRIDPQIAGNFQSIYNQPAYTPQQVAAQQITAAQLNPATMADSRGLGLQTRGFQAGAIGMLDAAARGAVPSAAEIQMRQGLGQAQSSALSLANSARGGAAQRFAAQRQAQTQVGALQQGAIAQTGMVRAQEQAAARNALTGALSGVRGQDMALLDVDYNTAAANAQLGQQANIANQGSALQAGIANQVGGLNAAQLQATTQLGAANGVLGAGQLSHEMFLGPEELRARVAAAKAAGDAALKGALINAAGGVLGNLTGGG